MPPDARVEQLLELILSSGRTPQDVCADAPELLEEVQERWHRITHVEAALAALFPRSEELAKSIPIHERIGAAPLLKIPGYDVTGVLGHGGMGVVYRGVHQKLDRVVAIKMLLADQSAAGLQDTALSRAARAIAALRHPNIVQVYDVGEVDNYPYFTMEYVDGGTLADQLDGVPTSVAYAGSTLVKLARAVEAAHRAGIVHRDLKPANVLLTSDGAPKVSDFGIALRAERDGTGIAPGRFGRVGTPSYMAPEQADDDHGPIGPLCDVYALGAILYEMLTGRPPFRGESTAETERQLLTQDPVPPSRLNGRVPRDMETICLKCLRKDPSRRYESPAALADDIERFQRNEPISARRVSAVERGVKWAQRNTALVAAVVAIGLLVGSVSAYLLWQVSSRRELNRAAEMDLREAVQFLQQSDFPAANRAIDRAVFRLEHGRNADLLERLAQARRDSALAAELEAIRTVDPGTVSGDRVTFEKAAEQYATVLRYAGVVDENEDPGVVARRVQESNIRETLVIALDSWALTSNRGGKNLWLREVIKRTSPQFNGWRDRALNPDTYNNPELRKALMADAPITRELLPLLNTAGLYCHDAGRDAIPFLTKVQEAFPDDFWANEMMAVALYDTGRLAEAVAYERAAIALRPNQAWTRYNLGSLLWQLEDMPGAVAQLRRSVELEPDSLNARIFLSAGLLQTEQYDEALLHLDEAIRLDPKRAQSVVYRGDALRLLQREDEALETYRQALAIDPNDKLTAAGVRSIFVLRNRVDDAIALWRKAMKQWPTDYEAWDGYAEYCLFLGRADEFARVRAELLSRFSDSQDASVCEHLGRACLLLADAPDAEISRATALIDRALQVGAASRLLPNHQVAKSLAHYRVGNYHAAISTLNGNPGRVLQPAPQLIIAMAQWRLGHVEESRAALSSAIAAFDWSPQRMKHADQREVWIYHILRREAEALINRP